MSGKTFYYDEFETPISTFSLLSDGEKVIRIDYGVVSDVQPLWEKWLHRYYGTTKMERKTTPFIEVKKELTAYFANDLTTFTFDYDLHGTTFQKQVWQALIDTIPYGETDTYKGIAERIHRPKAVRAVGGAVNKNPLSIVVPCHRVVGTHGKLVGYNGGLDKKEFLLEHELQLSGNEVY